MPIESHFSVEVRPRRRMARTLALSFAATLAVLVTAGAAVMHHAKPKILSPCTVSYSLTSTGVTHDWKTAPWSPSPSPGTYPGQASGDCVTIGGSVQVTLQTATISLADFTISSGSFGPTQVSFNSGASMTETAGNFSNAGTLFIASGADTTFSSASAQSVGGTVTVNGGTLTINDTFNLFGQILMHGGTLNGSGSLSVNSGVLTFDGTQSPMSVAMTNPINIDSFGSASYTSTNTSHPLSLSTAINVQKSATFFANADADLNGSGTITLVTDTTGSFSSGALTRSVGAGDILINVPVDNNGTVSVTSTSGVGGIVLAGGGTHTGTFNSSLSKISFSGTHNFNSSAVINAPSRVTGASTVINVNTTSPLSLSGISWDGGTINGPQRIDLTGASTFDTSVTSLQLNGEIQNKGTIQIEEGTSFNMGAASLLESSTTLGALELIGYVDIPVTTGIVRVDSGAYLESANGASVGTGEPNVGAYVDLNGGNIDVNSSDPLYLSGGGKGAATSYISLGLSGHTINFAGGTFTLNNPTPIGTITPGNIWIEGGIVNFAGTPATTINDNFDLRSGEFYGPDITLNRGMTWAGGEIGGTSGHTTVHIPSPQVVDSTTMSGTTTLHDATLDLSGTFNLNPSSNSLTVENGSTITINAGAVMDAQGDGNILSGSGTNTIANGNILKKSGGSSGTRFDTIVTNAGTISSESASGGTVILNGGGSMSSGTLSTLSSINTVDVAGGVFTISGGAIVGAGPTRTTITGEIDIAPATVIAANAFEMVNGTLGGSGELQIANLKWHAGTMNGGGTTTILNGSATLDGTGSMVLANRTFKTSTATVNYNATNALDIQSGGVLSNLNGTIDLQNNTPINGTTAGGQISNAAGQTIKKSNVGATVINVPLNNSGILQSTIDNGRFTLATTGTNTIGGSIDLSPGPSSSITFANGTTNMSGATVTGPGSVNIFSGFLNINSNESFPVFNLGNSGTTTVASPNQLTVTTKFSFDGGTLTGAGSTDATGAATGLDIGGSNASTLTGGHTLHAHTTTVYNGTNTNFLTIGPASTFINENGFTFNANNDNIIGGVGGTFSNLGTFAKNGSGKTTRIDSTFNHSGALTIASNAILNLAGGGTSTGTITNGGFLDFGGGTYLLNAGTSTAPGGTIKVTAGTVNSSINLTVPNFGLLNGTYTGTGTLAFTNAVWSGGTLSGSGSVTLNGGGSMTIDGVQAAMTLDTRAFTNNGTINYSPATNGLSLTNSASINNGATGIFDIKSDISINGGSITNAGTFQKTIGSGSPSLPSITNSGNVFAKSGTMSFPAFTQSAGVTNLIGGNIAVSPGTMQLNGGALNGNGTLNASVTNAGAAITPGDATTTGTINVTAAFAQSAGSLNVRLGGTATSQFDRLLVGGAANPSGGTFNATLFNGFIPSNGNTFDVFTFASKGATDFASKSLPTFAGGGSFTATYLPAGTPTKLQLQAVVTQADVGVTQTAPSSVLHNQNATIVITVNNAGPANATNVTLTDGFSGASFVSASPSQGTCNTNGNPITCSFGTIASTGSATLTLVLNANAIGTITNNAGVAANEVDPNTTNNNSSVTINVAGASDLGVTVSDSPDPVNAGQNVTYTIVTTNNGPDATASSVVNLSISGGGTIVSTTGATCTSPTASTRQCTLGGLANGASNTITLVVQAPASGPISATAQSVYSGDANAVNDSASQTTVVSPSLADVAVTKSGPAAVDSGGSISYTIVVKNVGTGPAAGVVLSDPTPARLTPTDVSGNCTALPCNIGTMNAGQTLTVIATYAVSAAGPGSVTNTATVSASNDTNNTNNSSSVTTEIGCTPNPVQLTFPAANATSVPTAGTLQWTSNGSASYIVHLDVAGVGCTTQASIGTTSSTQLTYSNLKSNTDYEWRVEATSPNCGFTTVSACGHFKTGANCTVPPPTPISPVNGATVSSPVHFSWSAVTGASQYELFVASNGGAATSVAVVTTTFADVNAVEGPGSWFVVATVPVCGTIQSATATFNACNTGLAPVPSVVADAQSGQSYAVSWDALPGATKYELDEATNAAFTGATTTPITPAQNATQVSVNFIKVVQQSAQPYFYRVRAFSGCGQVFGPYSQSVRIVILPPPPPNQPNPNINVPAGSTTKVTQQIFIPGQGANFNFSAVADEPWVTVSPSSGLLTPSGVTLTLTTDPTNLPNGTFTATIVVSLTPLGVTGRASDKVTTVVNVPVSVSLVTPVTPTTNSTLPAGALVIPSVGHLDGIDSHWQSDIRVTNAGFSKQNYSLTFTPDDPAKGTRSTQITIDAGATTALDDIVRNWYGIGQLGESANGVLEIHPATSSNVRPLQTTPSQSLVTVASSRTYNVTSTGTLGQYVPAIPFANFIGKAAGTQLGQVLSLQQIAQSSAYRTNFGVVEANGKPAEVVLSVFDNGGAKLKDIPLTIAAFQQIQLNSMLANNGINNLADGRVEVKVASGDGKITAYASVVDNFTNDPLLVSGALLNQITSNKYVLPGVAALNNGVANWRTDMRIFNPSTTSQNATLTFYPLGNAGPSIEKSMSIGAGQVTALDDVVQTLFGQTNAGGAVHVSTPTNTNLIVTGRTYDKTTTGTFGQFIPAITPGEALAVGGRALQVLQVEDSPRYRTNLGLAEVTGKPVVVEVSAILPDSRVTPSIQFTLGANEYRQDAIIHEMGLGNTYNARITVKVVSGEGKVMAYGSVIDQLTQDPTYVPAQ